MNIKEIRAVEIELNPKPTTTPRTPSRAGQFPMNRPVTRYAAADRRGEHVLRFGMEPTCVHCNGRRRHVGFRSLALWGSRHPNHQRSLCPATRR